MSPIKHQLRGPSGKYVSASEKARKVEEGLTSETKPKVLKIESDKEDSDLECYKISYGNPVHVDIDEEVTEGNNQTLARLPNIYIAKQQIVFMFGILQFNIPKQSDTGYLAIRNSFVFICFLRIKHSRTKIQYRQLSCHSINSKEKFQDKIRQFVFCRIVLKHYTCDGMRSFRKLTKWSCFLRP